MTVLASRKTRPRSYTLALAATLAATLTTLLALGGAGVAHAQSLYVAGGSGQFGILNALTGAYTSLGSTHIGASSTTTVLTGLGYAANGNLYGVEYGSPRLFQVNAQTASLTVVGTVGVPSSNFPSLLAGTSDGTLYVYAENTGSSTGSLYTVNPTTAAVSLVGSTGITNDGGLGGDGSGGLFLASASGAFYTFNRTTGVATTTNGSSGFGTAFALGYSPTNNGLYALNNSGGIYAINKTTGTATSTGATYNTSTVGVAFAAVGTSFAGTAATPEPESLALFAIAGLPAVGMIARRRRTA